MATSSATIDTSSGTNAGIQSWAGFIVNLLSAGGWQQAADTGQTAVSSLVACTAGGQVKGMQIWSMNDTLAGSAPVKIKLEFGSGTGISNPGLWITIGTGSDGSGNITGILVPRTQFVAGLPASSSATGLGSSSSNRVWFYVSNHWFFSLERSKDSSGSDTNTGLLYMLEGSANTANFAGCSFQSLRFSGTIPPASSGIGAFAPSGGNWSLGSDVGVCPVRWFEGQPSNPGLNFVIYCNADIAANNTPSVSMYGTNRTYYTLGSSRIGTIVGGVSTSAIAALWE